MRALRRTLQLLTLLMLCLLLATTMLPTSAAVKTAEWSDEAALLEVNIQLHTRFGVDDTHNITSASSSLQQQQQAVLQQHEWSLQVDELFFSEQESPQKRRVLHENMPLSVQWSYSQDERDYWNGEATSRLIFPLEQRPDDDSTDSRLHLRTRTLLISLATMPHATTTTTTSTTTHPQQQQQQGVVTQKLVNIPRIRPELEGQSSSWWKPYTQIEMQAESVLLPPAVLKNNTPTNEATARSPTAPAGDSQEEVASWWKRIFTLVLVCAVSVVVSSSRATKQPALPEALDVSMGHRRRQQQTQVEDHNDDEEEEEEEDSSSDQGIYVPPTVERLLYPFLESGVSFEEAMGRLDSELVLPKDREESPRLAGGSLAEQPYKQLLRQEYKKETVGYHQPADSNDTTLHAARQQVLARDALLDQHALSEQHRISSSVCQQAESVGAVVYPVVPPDALWDRTFGAKTRDQLLPGEPSSLQAHHSWEERLAIRNLQEFGVAAAADPVVPPESRIFDATTRPAEPLAKVPLEDERSLSAERLTSSVNQQQPQDIARETNPEVQLEKAAVNEESSTQRPEDTRFAIRPEEGRATTTVTEEEHNQTQTGSQVGVNDVGLFSRPNSPQRSAEMSSEHTDPRSSHQAMEYSALSAAGPFRVDRGQVSNDFVEEHGIQDGPPYLGAGVGHGGILALEASISRCSGPERGRAQSEQEQEGGDSSLDRQRQQSIQSPITKLDGGSCEVPIEENMASGRLNLGDSSCTGDNWASHKLLQVSQRPTAHVEDGESLVTRGAQREAGFPNCRSPEKDRQHARLEEQLEKNSLFQQLSVYRTDVQLGAGCKGPFVPGESIDERPDSLILSGDPCNIEGDQLPRRTAEVGQQQPCAISEQRNSALGQQVGESIVATHRVSVNNSGERVDDRAMSQTEDGHQHVLTSKPAASIGLVNLPESTNADSLSAVIEKDGTRQDSGTREEVGSISSVEQLADQAPADTPQANGTDDLLSCDVDEQVEATVLGDAYIQQLHSNTRSRPLHETASSQTSEIVRSDASAPKTEVDIDNDPTGKVGSLTTPELATSGKQNVATRALDAMGIKSRVADKAIVQKEMLENSIVAAKGQTRLRKDSDSKSLADPCDTEGSVGSSTTANDSVEISGDYSVDDQSGGYTRLQKREIDSKSVAVRPFRCTQKRGVKRDRQSFETRECSASFEGISSGGLDVLDFTDDKPDKGHRQTAETGAHCCGKGERDDLADSLSFCDSLGVSNERSPEPKLPAVAESENAATGGAVEVVRLAAKEPRETQTPERSYTSTLAPDSVSSKERLLQTDRYRIPSEELMRNVRRRLLQNSKCLNGKENSASSEQIAMRDSPLKKDGESGCPNGEKEKQAVESNAPLGTEISTDVLQQMPDGPCSVFERAAAVRSAVGGDVLPDFMPSTSLLSVALQDVVWDFDGDGSKDQPFDLETVRARPASRARKRNRRLSSSEPNTGADRSTKTTEWKRAWTLFPTRKNPQRLAASGLRRGAGRDSQTSQDRDKDVCSMSKEPSAKTYIYSGDISGGIDLGKIGAVPKRRPSLKDTSLNVPDSALSKSLTAATEKVGAPSWELGNDELPVLEPVNNNWSSPAPVVLSAPSSFRAKQKRYLGRRNRLARS